MSKNHHCYTEAERADENPLSRKVREIKQSLYLSMNGVLSSELRERGINYRVSFGVKLPVLRQMAQKIAPDGELASLLWAEDIRELKILAILLHPQESFTGQIAIEWIESVRFSEISELLAMYRLSKLDNPSSVILHCLRSEVPLVVYTGYCSLAKWFSSKDDLSESEIEFILNKALSNIMDNQLFLYNGAILALKKVGAKDIVLAKSILERIDALTFINCDKKHQIIDDLKFEFEYYLQTVL